MKLEFTPLQFFFFATSGEKKNATSPTLTNLYMHANTQFYHDQAKANGSLQNRGQETETHGSMQEYKIYLPNRI